MGNATLGTGSPNLDGFPVNKQRLFLRSGAVLGFLAVALGAFGAHGLESILTGEEAEIYETAVRYQAYHALAILAVAAGSERLWKIPWSARACGAWTAGIVLFSGTLYGYALTGVGWLAMLTPVGGAAMLNGWAFVFLAAGSLVVDEARERGG